MRQTIVAIVFFVGIHVATIARQAQITADHNQALQDRQEYVRKQEYVRNYSR